MPRYRWIGPNPVEIPDAGGLTVRPDQEFDAPAELNHPYCQLVVSKPAKSQASPED